MVAVLFNAGLQVPVMPFCEVVGKAVSTLPEQASATAAKVGRIGAITPMVIVVVVAHSPASGVKV